MTVGGMEEPPLREFGKATEALAELQTALTPDNEETPHG